MYLGLQDVHALVTGASGGIGLETARSFLEQGAKVTAHYNKNSRPIQELISDFGSNKIQSTQADLSVETDVERMFSCSAPFGPVQVIIVNQAIYPEAYVPVIDMTFASWDTTLKTNLTSSFLRSVAGKFGGAGHADYASSKSATMYGLTLTLKNEIVKIASKGSVNSVGPTFVKTRMVEQSLKDPDTRYGVLATTSITKIAEPSDVAKQILVLSSGVVSGHISGQVVMIDGGMEGLLQKSREDVGC